MPNFPHVPTVPVGIIAQCLSLLQSVRQAIMQPFEASDVIALLVIQQAAHFAFSHANLQAPCLAIQMLPVRRLPLKLLQYPGPTGLLSSLSRREFLRDSG